VAGMEVGLPYPVVNYSNNVFENFCFILKRFVNFYVEKNSFALNQCDFSVNFLAKA
jgi:hypothetical protein